MGTEDDTGNAVGCCGNCGHSYRLEKKHVMKLMVVGCSYFESPNNYKAEWEICDNYTELKGD